MASVKRTLAVCLLTAFGAVLHPVAQADTLQDTASIRKLAPDEAEPQQARAIFNAPSGVAGRLLYTLDTAVYGPGGFSWPWSLYLIHRRFPLQTAEVPAAERSGSVFYKIETRQHDFVLQPRFAPDGEHLAFKIGPYTSTSDTFTVYIHDVKTGAVETFVDDIGYAPVLWSPNSRYLAYWNGGIPYPGGSVPGPPLELRIYDRHTHQIRSVVLNKYVFGDAVWTPDNCLLYNVCSNPKGPRESRRMALYRFDPQGDGKAVLLLKDAVYPDPSPDGKWIAAYSMEEVTRTAAGTLQAVKDRKQRLLMLFPVGGGTPILANPQADYHYSSLLWASDSRCLYRFTNRYKGKGNLQVRFYEYTLATGTEKEIASLNYPVAPGREVYGSDPLFKPLCVSHDGRLLYFSLVLDADQQPEPGCILSDIYLKAVDLSTNEIITICRVPTAGGLDWLEEPAPAVKASSAR